MKTLLAKLKALWAKEPVLLSSFLPVLVTLGWLTQSQATTVTKVAAGVASVALEVAAAWKARSKVIPATADVMIKLAEADAAHGFAVLKAAAEGAQRSTSPLSDELGAAKAEGQVAVSAEQAAKPVTPNIPDAPK